MTVRKFINTFMGLNFLFNIEASVIFPGMNWLERAQQIFYYIAFVIVAV